FSADGGATWNVATGADDFVYNFEGDCDPLGVSENALEGFAYYPNPTSGILSLKSVNNIDSVAIFNLLGQSVLSSKIRATTSNLDISGLTTGAYIMKVNVEGQTGTYKVLKNKFLKFISKAIHESGWLFFLIFNYIIFGVNLF